MVFGGIEPLVSRLLDQSTGHAARTGEGLKTRRLRPRIDLIGVRSVCLSQDTLFPVKFVTRIRSPSNTARGELKPLPEGSPSPVAGDKSEIGGRLSAQALPLTCVTRVDTVAASAEWIRAGTEPSKVNDPTGIRSAAFETIHCSR